MDNKVLAIVDGREVKESDLQALMQNLGQNAAQFASEEGRKHLINEIVAQELLYSDALATKQDTEEEFLSALEQMTKSLLIQYTANNLMTSVKVDDAEIKAFFDDNPDAFKPQATAKASHILVEDEEAAEKTLKEIKEGLSFADASKKYSSCPSKENGGSLGEFARGQMVPEFEEVAFNMKAGEISEPVKSQFGYHLIQLDSVTDPDNVSFEDVKDQVKNQCLTTKQNQFYLEKQRELKAKYDVEIMD